jgi:hypothetical protein
LPLAFTRESVTKNPFREFVLQASLSRHQRKSHPCYGLQPVVDYATENKPCYGLQSVVDDEETERRLKTGRGAWDAGREQNELGRRGSYRAKTTASSEWRVANGE